MTETPTPTPSGSSRLVHAFSAGFLLAGLVLFEGYSETWFAPPPGGGINWLRMLAAALVGAVCGGLGYAIGTWIQRSRE